MSMDERNFLTRQAISEPDVIDFYDAYAGTWDARFGSGLSTEHFLEHRWQSFEKILGEGWKDATAIELGVGTGVYIDRAAKTFRHVIAVDGSLAMLEEFRQRLEKNEIKNVTPMRANVLSMSDIPSCSAQVVYFFGLFEHVINVDEFIQEVRRVLDKNGVVVGVLPNGACPWYSFRRFVRKTGKHCSTDRYYKEGELCRLWKSHGFVCRQVLYWGMVPAGIRSSLIYRGLALLERSLERTRIRRFLGGLTIRFHKTG